ncbi:hypothetical protein, partial [Salmonella enterica]|uniref:hypothetical protein n=1 Tax=Salmonella enterica TaxID=28901 RepID=UPI0019D2559D
GGARGSHQGETPGIFKPHRVSPPLIWASDFMMFVRGAEPMEKRLRRGLISSLLSSFLVSPRKFPPRL